jgi:hypothetical protein
MIPSPLRLIRGKQSGIVTVLNTMPAMLTNRIELNASFEIGMLAALDKSVKNADDTFPMLQDLKTVYGLEGLADIIDYSDMQITHLQRGGGKSTMTRHLEDIRKMTTSTQEVMNFYIEAIKSTPMDQGILVCTYLEDGVDYVEELKKVFSKAGIDLTATVKDDKGIEHPRIAFTTYGQHLSTNKFRYCSTGIAAGVQQRHKADIAGRMCGARKSIAAPINFEEVEQVFQAVAAADLQQLIGRLACRQVVNGKAKPTRVYVTHLDNSKGDFRARVKKAFPRATWIDQASVNRLKRSQTGKLVERLGPALDSIYTGQPISLTKSGRETIKKKIGSCPHSDKVLQRAITLFLKHNPAWCRVGYAVQKTCDRMFPTSTAEKAA